MGSVLADDVLPLEYVAVTQQPLPKKMKSQPVAPQYNNRVGLSPFCAIYERLELNCLYFGIDVWVPVIYSHNRHNHWGSLIKGEARVGYNLLYNGCDHVIPVAGVGYLFNNVGVFNHAKFGYVMAGLIYFHEFNSIFGWGINLKALAGEQLSNTEPKKVAWGVELSIPITFRFGHFRHWDVTVQPDYLYIESHHQHQGVFGGRGTLGYRF
jgi:hypothetical protein